MSSMRIPRQGLFATLALTTAGAAMCLVAPATAQAPESGSVRVAATGDKPELLKTIPIAKHADEERRVVMSLDSDKVGALEDGDRLEATAEVEVSVCLKTNPLHPGPGHSCIGKDYGYNPTVRTQLVLGPSASSSGAGSTVPVSGTKKLRCTQRLPNRNHHCVLVVDDGRLKIDDAQALPCSPDNCHLNLVLSAHNKDAKRGNRLVVGADAAGTGRVVGDKGGVNVARFRPGTLKKEDPINGNRQRSRLPIAASIGGHEQKKVLYSARIENPREGEQVIVEAEAFARISHLNYNSFMTTSMVLGENASSTRNSAPVNATRSKGRISIGNGFNCTQGRSGHRSPCAAKKVGVIEFLENVNRTLYVNLIGGMAAQFPEERHRPGDKAKILDKGFLRVYRFAG
jgi:hypothetical protein